MKKLIFTFLLFCLFVQGTKARSYIYSAGGYIFELWVPDDAPVIKGVYFELPYLGGSSLQGGRSFFTDIASYYDFAFLGMNSSFNVQSKSDADLLLSVLNYFSNVTGHPELKNAPLVLTGTSMGGRASYYLNSYIPERIIAYSGYRPAIQDYDVSNTNVLNAATPALFNPAELDDFYTYSNPIFEQIRELDGQAATIVSWGNAHQGNCFEGGAYFLKYYFLNKVIEQRYPWNESPLDNPVNLQQIPITQGWLADHASWNPITEVYPYSEFPGVIDKKHTSWLPNKDMAYVYKAASTYRNSTTSCYEAQHLLRISSVDLINLETDSTYCLSVYENGIANIEYIIAYDGATLLSRQQTDSLSIRIKQSPGMHLYWGMAVDADSNRYVTSLLMSCVNSGKFNPQNLPVFSHSGNVSTLKNTLNPIYVQLTESDTLRNVRYTFSPEILSFATMDFDPELKQIKLIPIVDSIGSQEFSITAISETEPKNEYTRKFNYAVHPDKFFEVTPIVKLAYNSTDTNYVLPIKTIKNASLNFSLLSSEKDYTSKVKVISFNSETGQLAIKPRKDKYGTVEYKITATDAFNPAFSYSQTVQMIVDKPTADEPVIDKESMLSVYPNPVEEYLYFTSDINNPVIGIDVFNASGQLVYAAKNSAIEGNKVLLKQLTSGIYFVNIATDKNAYKYKIIKK